VRDSVAFVASLRVRVLPHSQLLPTLNVKEAGESEKQQAVVLTSASALARKRRLAAGDDVDWAKQHPGSFVQCRLGPTHYLLLGEPSGDLVVFLHGASMFSFIWHQWADQLVARGHRVLLYDFYGHGWSAIPDVNYTISVFLEQLEDVLRALDLSNTSFHLVGHSMGALLGAEFAAKHPQQVRKLVMMNSAGLSYQGPSLGQMSLQAGMSLIRRFRFTDRLATQITNALSSHGNLFDVTYEDVCREAIYLNEEIYGTDMHVSSLRPVNALVNSLLPAKARRFVKACKFLWVCWAFQARVNHARDRVFLSVIRDCPLVDADHSTTFKALHSGRPVQALLTAGDPLPALAAPPPQEGHHGAVVCFEPVSSDGAAHHPPEAPTHVKVPVLLLWGEDDGLTPTAFLHEIRTYLPEAQVHLVRETDHAMFLQRPGEAFGEILRFIKRPDQARPPQKLIGPAPPPTC
jgi:pimeloyl-ACP methyl ester carboxylesterase